MQVKVFSIPAHGDDEAEAGLNRFLRGHRVIAVERQFVADGPSSFWSVWVSFLPSAEGVAALPKRGKRDEREILPDADLRILTRSAFPSWLPAMTKAKGRRRAGRGGGGRIDGSPADRPGAGR